MAANSSLGASSSLESIGGGTTSPGSGTSSIRRRENFSGGLSKWVSRMASCAVPGLEDHGVARPRVGHRSTPAR